MVFTKKKIALAGGIAAVLIAGIVTLILVLPRGGASGPGGDTSKPAPLKPIPDAGPYTGYHLVVTAKNTPDPVLEELGKYGVTPVEYEKNRSLLGPGGLVDPAALPKDAKIFVCEGKYETGTGPFISLKSSGLSVTGAGTEKTLLQGGGILTGSNSAAFLLTGAAKSKVSGVQVSALTVKGFRMGFVLEYAQDIRLSGLDIRENKVCGITLSDASGVKVEGCNIEKNGDPEQTDTGFGIAFLKNNTGVQVADTAYRNNANKNAVDFPGRGEKDKPDGAQLQMNMSYDLVRTEKPVVDPEEQAQNAKPTEKSISVECEKGELTGAEITANTEKIGKFSGSGYVFLYDGRITMRFQLGEAGKYRIFVVGGTTEPNNKCDFVRVNNGPAYLTSYLAKNAGKWISSQPGAEYWENNELLPRPLTNGFDLKKGENVIEISANWGYAAYDRVLIEKIG